MLREGEQLIPVGDTEFARDAAFGYRASNLRAWVVEKAGGQVAGCAFLVELGFLNGRQRLPRCEVFSLIKY